MRENTHGTDPLIAAHWMNRQIKSSLYVVARPVQSVDRPPASTVADMSSLRLLTTSVANPMHAERGKLKTNPTSAKFDPKSRSRSRGSS
mmetsp:Transcript_16359/g.37426  ORF Transcript_16359/g.37426 Transcript_16359/m.37426 type:complete len:89 (-) Transcript_16359:1349-1615(-)